MRTQAINPLQTDTHSIQPPSLKNARARARSNTGRHDSFETQKHTVVQQRKILEVGQKLGIARLDDPQVEQRPLIIVGNESARGGVNGVSTSIMFQ